MARAQQVEHPLNNLFTLVIAPRGAKIHWVSPGSARLFFPTWFQAQNIGDLESIPNGITLKLLQDFDAEDFSELWTHMEKNITIHAPGEFYNEMVPSKLPRRPARLTQHATYMLTHTSVNYVGPLQARLIMIALIQAFKLTKFTEKDVQFVLDQASFNRNWKGKQLPFKVFTWYRPWYIEQGCMLIVPSTGTPAKLNSMPSAELHRLKPTKRRKK